MSLPKAFPLTAALLAVSSLASAQDSMAQPQFSDALTLGDWLIRPSVQLRTRAEYRFRPFDAAAVDTTRGNAEANDRVENEWLVLERARLGLTVDRGMLRGTVQFQDARVWGEYSPLEFDNREDAPTTMAYQAFGELHGRSKHPSFLRVGRQEIQWGEGRLLGKSDWLPQGRSLDAARGLLVLGNFDIEALASILQAPGSRPAELRNGEETVVDGPGTQLYGLRIGWNIGPLLVLEWNNLFRTAREPLPDASQSPLVYAGVLQPSDLGLTGLRISGDHMGLSYSLEGAYERGRKATVGATPTIQAYAGAARVEYITSLPWKLGVGAEGAYASGDKNDPDNSTRFDPILPDARTTHGAMGLYNWSNVMEGAGLIGMTPIKESRLTLAYRYVSLVEASDWWQMASLYPVGRDLGNTSHTLGHELDATFQYSPWAPLELVAGYGAFITGDGAKAILHASGRSEPDLQHYGFLQATLQMP